MYTQSNIFKFGVFISFSHIRFHIKFHHFSHISINAEVLLFHCCCCCCYYCCHNFCYFPFSIVAVSGAVGKLYCCASCSFRTSIQHLNINLNLYEYVLFYIYYLFYAKQIHTGIVRQGNVTL